VGGSRSGDTSAGGLQKGKVGRQTLTSHVAKKFRGGRVSLGGVRLIGVSFHLTGSDGVWLAAGVAADRPVLGGSLAILWLSYLQLCFIFAGSQKAWSRCFAMALFTLLCEISLPRKCASPLLLIFSS